MTSERKPEPPALASKEQFAASMSSVLAERTLADRARRTEETQEEPAPAFSTTGDRYQGPQIRVDGLGLPTMSASNPTDAITPPNLVVVGGSAKQARLIAEAVQHSRGGVVRSIALAGATAHDLAAVVTSLDARDILFVSSVDNTYAETVDLLDDLMAIWPSRDGEEAGELERRLHVLIGSGDAARSLTLSIPPWFLIVRTWSGKVPEPLRDWGAQVIVSIETKLCPRCAEEIKAAATACRFCGYEMDRTS
jgi:hypothetical protein